MRRLFDGFASLLAAIITGIVGFGPAWFAHLAIDAGVAPAWGYVVIAGLVIITGIMVMAFLRKTFDGIAPLRERRR